MGILKQYRSGVWESRARGGGSGGSSTAFASDFSGTASGDTSLTTAVYGKIGFDTATRDGNSEFNTTTDKWVCASSGTYVVNAILRFTANATGYRGVFIVIDGDSTATSTSHVNFFINNGATYSGRAVITKTLAFTAGQTVEIYGLQTSGGALACTADGSAFQVWRIQ